MFCLLLGLILFGAALHFRVFEGILDAIEQNFLSGDQLPEMMAASLGQILEVLKQETNPTSRSCAAECMRDVLHACYTSGAEATDGDEAV